MIKERLDIDWKILKKNSKVKKVFFSRGSSCTTMTNIIKNNWLYNSSDNIFKKCVTLKVNLKNYESYYEWWKNKILDRIKEK